MKISIVEVIIVLFVFEIVWTIVKVFFSPNKNYKIMKATQYFDKQVGHFTDHQKVMKIKEEVNELDVSLQSGNPIDMIEECSDVATIAYHIAVRNGYKGTPSDLYLQAYKKMKHRIDNGERDYINKDF